MKATILCLTVLILCSCSATRNRCVTPEDVRRFDRRPFRAQHTPSQECSTLVKITRTMKGQTHYFVTDKGDTIRKILYKRLKVGESYLISKEGS